ncbi:unnamed protein product [Ilex paraguariensis]|uniref:DUF7054 domain-containing protein n=1 Tax=Ilex paraguariensis TaxID=185542 RepID=A0ABC8UI25_9AQUA
MTTPPQLRRPNGVVSHLSASNGGRVAKSDSVTNSQLVRKHGGFIDVPKKLTQQKVSGSGTSQKLTKLLLNVSIQNSLGPIQVVMSPENTVRDLTKSAVDIYVKEKRRPLLSETDPRCFELHYSSYSLESLKPEEKLINLGSRNFFCCRKANSSCSDEAKAATSSTFPLTKFMDFLL